MKLKYLGEYTTETRSYGCSSCGTGGRSVNKEVYKTQYRMYYGGRLYVFNKDEVQEVADGLQGKYLLGLRYIDKDEQSKPAFEEVADESSEE